MRCEERGERTLEGLGEVRDFGSMTGAIVEYFSPGGSENYVVPATRNKIQGSVKSEVPEPSTNVGG